MSAGAAQQLSVVPNLATNSNANLYNNHYQYNQNQNNQYNQNQNNQNQNNQNQVPVSALVNAQVQNQFAQFAGNFYALEGQYFAHVNNGGASGIDYATYQSQVKDLVNNLNTQVLSAINHVPGGSGILQNFVTLRLASNKPGSFLYDLQNLPQVGSATGLNTTGFDHLAGTSIEAAMLSTQNMVNFYDQTLGFGVNNFFNGSYHYFNTGQYSQDLPTSDINNGGVLNSVNSAIFQQFGQFSQQYNQALTNYLDSVNNGTTNANGLGDIATFRNTVGGLVQNLTTNVTNVIDNVPGGAPLLTNFLRIRLGSNLGGSLNSSLQNIPPVSTSGLTANGFAINANTAVQNALVSSVLFTTMYDQALNQVATGFFNQYSNRFIRNGGHGYQNLGNGYQNLGNGYTAARYGGNIIGTPPQGPNTTYQIPAVSTPGLNNSTVTTPGLTRNPVPRGVYGGNGVSANNGTVSTQAYYGYGLNSGAYSPNGYGYYGTRYNPYSGYGGLGNGYNFGYGLYNTGFGYGAGASSLYGYNLGYGTGYGLGNTYGLYGGTAGLGTGLMGLGFGGFYY